MKWRKKYDVEYFYVFQGSKRPWSLVDHSIIGKMPTAIMYEVVQEGFAHKLPPGPSDEMIDQIYALQVSPCRLLT
jgi:hypothetical protein